MKHRQTFARECAFALLLVAAGALVLPMLADPTPPAGAQTAQPAEANLRGRSVTPSRNLRVIDGDTLEDMATDVTYRVVNIDTPETGARAACDAERNLGDQATRRVRMLVADAARLDIRPTGRIDRYGRAIAYVAVDGRDLGETLIEQHLARPWRGRREPWCDAYGALLR